MIQVSYNFDVFSEKLSEMIGALSGRGGDAVTVLKTETGQLAGRIGDSLGPSSREKAFARVDRDIKQQLTTFPMFSNLDEDQQYSSTADFTWLSASPKSLVGINDEDNQVNASGVDALEFLRGGQRAGSRGDTYVQLGKRGHQRVQRSNRVRVSRTAFRYVQQELRNRTGELRACFYRVALYFVPSKNVPAWILARIEQVEAKGKSSLNDNGLNSPLEPFIEFTVRAPGVVNNPQIADKITSQMKASSKIIAAKLRKVLAGYAYGWKTGRIAPVAQSVMDESEASL
jgi:hypothetical protein